MAATRQPNRIAGVLLCLALLTAGSAWAESVRELVTIQGAAPIPLNGIGIVTGLANTGDKKIAAQQLLRKYLSNNNFEFDESSLATGNIAIVRVMAEWQPFSRPGQKFAVSVSSINDAKSLAGGELLACDLFDGYSEAPVARATGQVVTGAGILTRGMIMPGQNGGGMLLATYPFGNVMNKEGVVRLNLNRPNWADAVNIARQINQTPALNPNLKETLMFAEAGPTEPVAYAKDAGQLLVRVPQEYRYNVPEYIATILDVPVAVNRPAMIVVNRARNSIVVTGDIRVSNAVVSLQDKTVTIQPGNEEDPARYVLANDTPRRVVETDGPGTYANLQGLIDTLNAMGLTTEQIITIFEQLRSAGAINADLINQ